MKHLCFYSAVPTPALPVCCITQENLLQESCWEAGSLQDALQDCSRSGSVAEAAGVLPNSCSTSTLQRQCVHHSAWSASVTWSTELQLLPKWSKFSHRTQIFLCIRELWLRHGGDRAGIKAMLHWPTLTSPLSSAKPFSSSGCHRNPKDLAAALRKKNKNLYCCLLPQSLNPTRQNKCKITGNWMVTRGINSHINLYDVFLESYPLIKQPHNSRSPAGCVFLLCSVLWAGAALGSVWLWTVSCCEQCLLWTVFAVLLWTLLWAVFCCGHCLLGHFAVDILLWALFCHEQSLLCCCRYLQGLQCSAGSLKQGRWSWITWESCCSHTASLSVLYSCYFDCQDTHARGAPPEAPQGNSGIWAHSCSGGFLSW